MLPARPFHGWIWPRWGTEGVDSDVPTLLLPWHHDPSTPWWAQSGWDGEQDTREGPSMGN